VPKDSRSICGGRLEAMNGELWVPGKPSFTKPYCSKRGSATTGPIFSSYSWNNDGEREQRTKPTKYKQTAAILEDQEWKHQEYWETEYS
jgi:hypothetical protein